MGALLLEYGWKRGKISFQKKKKSFQIPKKGSKNVSIFQKKIPKKCFHFSKKSFQKCFHFPKMFSKMFPFFKKSFQKCVHKVGHLIGQTSFSQKMFPKMFPFSKNVSKKKDKVL